MKIIAEKFATPHATEKNLKNLYFRSIFKEISQVLASCYIIMWPKQPKLFFWCYIVAREGVQCCSIFMLQNSDKVSNFLSKKNRLRMGDKWCYKKFCSTNYVRCYVALVLVVSVAHFLTFFCRIFSHFVKKVPAPFYRLCFFFKKQRKK